ncbi:MAG: KamA family radical SAM protein [Candidatus Aenigmarchaeota archaeon]|nr:KamA family radical SAM protein [Candidatus Aenigmarchaeota archaeon]
MNIPKYKTWQEQVQHSITSIDELSKYLPMSKKEKGELLKVTKKFPLRITPYFLSLINLNDKNDPLRLQVIPSTGELLEEKGEELVAWDKEACYAVKGIEHKYPDRVAFLVTRNCAGWCRHCVRKVMCEDVEGLHLTELSFEEIDKAIEYIRNNRIIWDILLTGGDLFMISDKKLEYILKKLREIEHVKIIRIATRTLTYLPQRVTPELIKMISKYQKEEYPLYIGTQFNHSGELTPEAKKACKMLSDAGFIIYNQAVLLKGVNDNAEILEELFKKLLCIKVRPYYLYHCMPVLGTKHLRTTVKKGVELMQKLQGRISGLAIPQYIIASKEGGKIPIPYRDIKFLDGKVEAVNYEGKKITYFE